MQYRVLLLVLVGCGFQVAGGSGDVTPNVDAPIDMAMPMIDAAIDAPIDAVDMVIDAPIDAVDMVIDAPIDAPPTPSITNHPSVADSFIASDVPTQNFSTQTSALADGGSTPRTALFRFDLSSIPTTAVVTGAQLFIWTDYDPGQTVTIYSLLESWTESQVTWDARSSGVAWAAAGATPPSRSMTVAGTVTPTQSNTGYVVTIAPATVAGWVANPATNHGLAIVTSDSDGSRFSTRENTIASVRPYLSVTHVP